MNYVWVDKNSIDNFLGVLPEDFIENPGNICICACGDNGDAWGAICYSLVDNQIDILWLYTTREMRRQGVATALLDKLFEVISLSGEIYPVSARFEPYSDEGVYGFYLSYDRMDTVFSHERFYVSPKEVRGAKLPPAGDKDEFEKTEFFSLPEAALRSILRKLQKEQGFIISDLRDFTRDAVPGLCRCIMRGNELLDLILIRKRPDGNLELSFLYSENTKGLMELLTATAFDIEEMFPDAKLVFDAVTEESASMAKRLFPWTVPVPVYEAQF